MPSELKIKIGAEWRWQDGDGSKCYFCGDAAWLKQRRLIMTTTGDVKSEHETEYVLCQSCGESINAA